MAKKLDAQRIESARKQQQKTDKREEEKKHIRDTVAKYRKNAAAEESNLLIGTLTDAIEQFCPADIYKNKGIFADVAGIGEKIRRFMARPMKNYFTGSREIDPEYNIDRNEV